MRLLKFFESISGRGTFVAVRFDEDTIDHLVNWMATLGLDNPVPPEELHTTLLIDKENWFDWVPTNYDPKLEVDPSSYSMELFGKENNVLVLKYKQEELENKHMYGRVQYNLPYDFDEYLPHVTLQYAVDDGMDIDSIPIPDFPLYISHEYVTPFDSDYA